jgi:hypothetical protein
MPHGPEHFNYPGAIADVGNFQALYEKAMGLPTAGRNLYQSWLGGRWKEAARNWALSSDPSLNVVMPEGGDASTATAGEFVNEEFEDYLARIRASEDPNAMFGGQGLAGGRTSAQFRLNQLQGMEGVEQRALIESLSDRLAGTGVTGRGVINEAFLNAMQARFGRRGGRTITSGSVGSPELARQFEISPTGALDPTGDESFLNQRLADLRTRYGF